MVGSGIGLAITAFSNRNKLQYDKDKLQYDVKLAVLEDRQKRCETDGIAKDIRIASLEAHIITLTAADVRDRIELEAKITTIKNGSVSDQSLPVVK